MRALSRPPVARSWLLLAVLLGLLAGILPWLAGSSLLLAGIVLGGLAVVAFLVLGWPFSGVAVLILAALLTRYRLDVGPVSVRAEHVSAVAVALIGGFHMLASRGRLRLPLAVWLALGWWAANAVSGLFFSPLMATGLQNAIRLFLLVLTLALVVNLIPDRRHWWWAIALFLAAGVAEAAFGILARALFPLGINLGVQVSWNFTEPIPYGTFEEGNLFGSHVAAWALLLLMLLLASDPRSATTGLRSIPPVARPLLWLGLAVLLLGLFLSLSRGAWLMFGAGAALLWVVSHRNTWHLANRGLLLVAGAPFLILVVLGVAPLLPASWPFVDRLQSFLSLSSDATFSARLGDWALAWNDWLQQPLTGWGPGSFADIHGELRARPAWISNLSLRLLQESGVVGAVFFAVFVYFLLLPAVKAASQQPGDLDRAALLGLVIAYLALLLIAYQSTDGIWLAASWVHAGLIAAGARVLSRHVDGTRTDTDY